MPNISELVQNCQAEIITTQQQLAQLNLALANINLGPITPSTDFGILNSQVIATLTTPDV